jgi:hypothetical protein
MRRRAHYSWLTCGFRGVAHAVLDEARFAHRAQGLCGEWLIEDRGPGGPKCAACWACITPEMSERGGGPMRVHFILTAPNGRTVLARGATPTHELAVHNWTNLSEVARMAHTSDVRDELGQMLIMWVWRDAR